MSTAKATSVKFLSAESFKKIIGATALEVVFNAKSNKLSVLDKDSDKFYRCQQGIDLKKPMAFLIPDGSIDDACLVNIKNDSPLTTKLAL